MFGFVRIGRRFKPDPAEEGANCTGYTKPDGTEVVFDKPVNVWRAIKQAHDAGDFKSPR